MTLYLALLISTIFVLFARDNWHSMQLRIAKAGLLKQEGCLERSNARIVRLEDWVRELQKEPSPNKPSNKEETSPPKSTPSLGPFRTKPEEGTPRATESVERASMSPLEGLFPLEGIFPESDVTDVVKLIQHLEECHRLFKDTKIPGDPIGRKVVGRVRPDPANPPRERQTKEGNLWDGIQYFKGTLVAIELKDGTMVASVDTDGQVQKFSLGDVEIHLAK